MFGGSRPIRVIRRELPDLQSNSEKTEKSCLIAYLALGWLGYIPRGCRNSLLIVPVNLTPWLWGWPNRFLRRMHNVGTDVFVADTLKPGGLKVSTARKISRSCHQDILAAAGRTGLTSSVRP